MTEFTSYLRKLLGREAAPMEEKAFRCFDPASADRKKRFARYSESKPLFLNIDDENYVYVSNHGNALRCRLDMATRHLDASVCYQHPYGNIMLGVMHPGKERHLQARFTDYHIYVQPAAAKAAAQSLGRAADFADHIAMITEETPWERLCRVCVATNTGGHITTSHQRLFTPMDNGLLYFVARHSEKAFKEAAAVFDHSLYFIGKTVAHPILSLDNEDGLLEVPLSTLRALQQVQNKAPFPKTYFNIDTNETTAFDEKPLTPGEVDVLLTFLDTENMEHSPESYTLSGGLPELRIDPYPLKGLAFSENGVQLHTLSAMTDLFIRGLRPIALTWYMETSAESPQEIEPLITMITKSAGLFDIPVANFLLVPSDTDRLHLFFISRNDNPQYTGMFEDAGDFICLLGDPNGTLCGSAYAMAMGNEGVFHPPSVMTGTLASLVDVIDTCFKKNIIRSAAPVRRGGLIAALYRACSAGKGAAIYAERKSPEREFMFGEPQAAVMVSLKEKHLIDLARITSHYNLTSTTIGRVTDKPEITLNNAISVTLKADPA
ncbi:MAG: hypothetical protein K0B52_03370 [FCB group bacterium]|nr:hypothetical protein [FCB group bacterium]